MKRILLKSIRILVRSFALSVLVASLATAQETVPTVDISQDAFRQVVVAAGTPDVYQGHPYLVKNPDDSLLLVWNIGHGGYAGPIAASEDGGLTWTRLDSNAPEGFRKHKNCPSVYRLVAADGKVWHWVFTSQPWTARIVNGDGGKTWEEKEPLGFANVMAFSSIIPKRPGVQDGCYIGFFHRRRAADGTVLNEEPPEKGRLEVVLSETNDAGFTWSEPRLVGFVDGRDLCEPFAFWSPSGDEICCLMRENSHKDRSMVMFSQDGGESWSIPKKTSWELTGDRHIGVSVGEDRYFIAFRDQAPESKTRGHFVGWVGSYEDIKEGRPGEYRVKLLHSFSGSDCGYPGVALLSDGTVIALTYIKYRNDDNKHSIVETRFSMDELDQKAEETRGVE